jgi:hypothetical protein
MFNLSSFCLLSLDQDIVYGLKDLHIVLVYFEHVLVQEQHNYPFSR